MTANSVRSGIAAVVVLELCAACASGAPQPSLLPLASAHTQAGHHALADGIDTTRGKDLLYVADQGELQAGAVDVFTYPRGERVGTLTGFMLPEGLCADALGDVFVTNSYPAQTLEYAHGGVTPIATFVDPLGFPDGCAVDPTTGNLAIASYSSGILVYSSSTGDPAIYREPNLAYYLPPTYDDKGDLFVEGKTTGESNVLVELPAGSKTFHYVEMNLQINEPGGAGWDGKDVVVDDELYQSSGYSGVYRVKVTGRRGTVVGSTRLAGSCEGSFVSEVTVAKPLSHPKTPAHLVGATNSGGTGTRCSAIEFWKYPNAGNPVETITGPLSPTGVALSYAQ